MSEENSEPTKEVVVSNIEAIKIIADDTVALEEARKAMNVVLKDASMRLKVFMYSVARGKMKSMANMLEMIDRMEEKVKDPAFLDSLPPHLAAELMLATHKRLDMDIEILQKLTKDSDADILADLLARKEAEVLTLENTKPETLAASSREKIRALFAKYKNDTK